MLALILLIGGFAGVIAGMLGVGGGIVLVPPSISPSRGWDTAPRG